MELSNSLFPRHRRLVAHRVEACAVKQGLPQRMGRQRLVGLCDRGRRRSWAPTAAPSLAIRRPAGASANRARPPPRRQRLTDEAAMMVSTRPAAAGAALCGLFMHHVIDASSCRSSALSFRLGRAGPGAVRTMTLLTME